MHCQEGELVIFYIPDEKKSIEEYMGIVPSSMRSFVYNKFIRIYTRILKNSAMSLDVQSIFLSLRIDKSVPLKQSFKIKQNNQFCKY